MMTSGDGLSEIAWTKNDFSEAGTVVQPQVGEWWTTPDGISWRVDAVTERTVKLSTSRSYGVMKASAHRAEFVRRARRRSQRSESYE